MEPRSETNDVDRHVGARVRLARLRLQASLADVARAIGVPEIDLRRIEDGDLRLSASQLHGLSNTLGQPVGYFFDGLA